MAKALPRGVREKNGSYEARAVVNGIRINLYGTDLNELMEEFEKAKENARDTLDYRKTRITLNEWFEEWFSERDYNQNIELISRVNGGFDENQFKR